MKPQLDGKPLREVTKVVRWKIPPILLSLDDVRQEVSTYLD
jgi:hypothetical protein